MAYYEFECEKCRERFTVEQSFTEHDHAPKPKCPKCGSRKVGRLISEIHVKTTKKS